MEQRVYKEQDKLTGQRRAEKRTHHVALQGMISCTYCDGVITWQLQKGKYYGTCHRKTAKCSGRKYIRRDFVEDLILQHFKELICPSKAVIGWLVGGLEKQKVTIAEQSIQSEKAIKSRIKRLKSMDSTLYDDKLAGEIDSQLYKEKHKVFMQEIDGLQQRLSELDETLTNDINHKITIIKLTQKAAEEYSNGDFERQQEILGRLIESIEADSEYLTIRFTELVELIARNRLKSRELRTQLYGGNMPLTDSSSTSIKKQQKHKPACRTNKKDPINGGLSAELELLRPAWQSIMVEI